MYLNAGFKAIHMPMDFDGDEDDDLFVSESGAYIEAGFFILKILVEMLKCLFLEEA